MQNVPVLTLPSSYCQFIPRLVQSQEPPEHKANMQTNGMIEYEANT